MRLGLMVTQAVLQNALGNHNRAYPESIELVCTKVNPSSSSPRRRGSPRPFVDNLLTVLGLCGLRPVSRGVWRKKAKKQKKFSQNPLPGAKNCSIIGLTLGKGVAEAREAAGKIEGIGDVLSDGSKNFLGKSIRT